MAQDWTTSDLALVLALPAGPRPGERLQAALRDAIRQDVLGDGDALPATRELAAELGVARGTVVHVYEQLGAEGYLVARAGGRTRVSSRAVPPRGRAQPRPAAAPRGADLRPGVPDLRRFPAGDWAWAYARAVRSAGSHDLDYGDGRGHPTAREAVAGHLRRVRAAATDADHVVLCQGFAQGLALLLPVLAARGVRVLAVEDPGDRAVDDAVRAAGIELAPLPLDAHGLRTELLHESGAHAVLVTPAHQSPTGVVLSASRRLELVEWATRSAAWIIEDDYDSEFRYDRQPLGALQGLAPDRIVLVGSASKAHAPGVRIAWMAVPGELVDDLAARRIAADRGGPVIDQLAFAALLESGRHDKHVRTMRGVYAARRAIVLQTLARVSPGLTMTGLVAGFHGVLRLPPGVREDEVVAAAADASLRVTGLAAFTRHRRDLPPALVLGFGDIDDEAVVEAIQRLASVIAAAGGGVLSRER
ncbi:MULTISPECIES: MocR-like pyridoxine biosynthesis transcription factor PdxR [unclassified Microbacterium]|uniref:MocR-like pyridoxine biosynthesis transcription factor PdxR n=1 Tax=unclassified Microbacterium TaxID=2609290 RepID=UPI0030102159